MRLPRLQVALSVAVAWSAVPSPCASRGAEGDTLSVHADGLGKGQTYILFDLSWPKRPLKPGPSILRVDGREDQNLLTYQYRTTLEKEFPEKEYSISGVDVIFDPARLVAEPAIRKVEFESDVAGTPIHEVRYLRVLPAEYRLCQARLRVDSGWAQTADGRTVRNRKFHLAGLRRLDTASYMLPPSDVFPAAGIHLDTIGFAPAQDEQPSLPCWGCGTDSLLEGVLVQSPIRDSLVQWSFVAERPCDGASKGAPFPLDSALRVLNRVYPPGSEGNPFRARVRMPLPFFGEGVDPEGRFVEACHSGGAWRISQKWILPPPWVDGWNVRILESAVDTASKVALTERKSTTIPISVFRGRSPRGVAAPRAGITSDALGRLRPDGEARIPIYLRP